MLVEKLWNQVNLFLAGFNNLGSQCRAASTTTQFDAETLDAVSAAYCTTHHLTSMESLWEKSGKTKTSLLQSYCLWRKLSRAHGLILTVHRSVVTIQRIMLLKPIHWEKILHNDMFFKEWTADVSSGRLERFGENDMFFKEWRSCRYVYSMNGF